MPTLDWIGKKAVINHDKQVPFHLLNEVPELSYGDKDSGNMLIQGDNLVALKSLLPYYAGKVKCIYIDPPYNTGNEGWIYNDNVNSPEIREWLGNVVGKEAEDLSRHDKWLCMMYPRLKLLREFLREDGSIWISIDDNEVGVLRILLDEIFGRSCFVASNIWQKRYSRENREAIGDAHEYVLIYAKNVEAFKEKRNRVPFSEEQAKVYKNPNNDPKGRWRGIPMTAQGWRPNQMYPIETPKGIVHYPPKGRCWSTIESEFLKLKEAGRIYFGKDNKSQPSIIRYLSEAEGITPWTWWNHEEVGHTDEAKKEIYALFGADNPFETPKPERLVERVIHIASNPGDIVMDSYLGSGTTCAVAHKMGRRYIGVEMGSHCETHCALRLKKVIDGEQGGVSKELEWKGGGGFRYYRLGNPLFDEFGNVFGEVKFADLAKHVYFSETGTPLPNSNDLTTPFIGEYNNRGIFLLYNGILKDKNPKNGNVLTREVLAMLPDYDGEKVIYGTGCRLSAARLKAEKIIFKQIPYDLRG
ncbi:MAG: site-specific DNA-methyltransferase [Lentisphaeria bacterium]|nr:site-specific DNA-methyltransferase [Lentisphaeria bacterium]